MSFPFPFWQIMMSPAGCKGCEWMSPSHIIIQWWSLRLIARHGSSLQSSHSVLSDSLRPRELQQHQASLSVTDSRSLLKPRSMESVMPPNHLILCRPLLLPPSISPSIRVLSYELVLRIRWPKDWSFSFSISRWEPNKVIFNHVSFKTTQQQCRQWSLLDGYLVTCRCLLLSMLLLLKDLCFFSFSFLSFATLPTTFW